MFKNLKCKEWWKAAGIRAVKTMAQTAVATIGTATLVTDINWLMVASATVLAGVLSLLTSVSGLPECSGNPEDAAEDETVIDESPDIDGEVIEPLTAAEQAAEDALLGNLVPTEKDGE